MKLSAPVVIGGEYTHVRTIVGIVFIVLNVPPGTRETPIALVAG